MTCYKDFGKLRRYPPALITLPMNKLVRHFVETHIRDELGRYIVRLPFKDSFRIVLITPFSTLKNAQYSLS